MHASTRLSNHYTYFRFPNAALEWDSKEKSGLIEKGVVKILSAIFPIANPDFEHLLAAVVTWEIEYNSTEDAAWREIGLDEHDKPIVAMPDDRNYGFWTDNNLSLSDFNVFDPTDITQQDFDKHWEEFKTHAGK